MKIFKAVFTSIMILVAGFNGLLGSQGVATLCIHGTDFLHFTLESHNEENTTCGEHSCEDSEPVKDSCTDIELKGVDNEAPQRNGFDGLPNPHLAELASNHFDSNIFAVATSTLQILPPPRGPPLPNSITQLCIKKTVLRL